ncbi:MAG: glycosyltransferase family 2 protein [Candidatus Omnitrophica bacterium]|nr:glycosyltransferase family 2 protein [Candidatus Omnitrophota bacterium]
MLSVIVLTRNSIDYISHCLRSLCLQDIRGVEVIVSDNGSDDGTLELIRRDYPQVLLIENNQNIGSCKARNRAIEAAQGEWILTLDCDAVLGKDFIAKALKAIDTLTPDTGIVQPKVLSPGSETIYSCGIRLSWSRRFYDIGSGAKNNGHFSKSMPVFGACSAVALYRRSMLEDLKEETGYFDERFFFLVEDVDLAWRAQKKGWKGIFLPELLCCHSGDSSRSSRAFRQYLCFRNRYYSIAKNDSLKNYFIKVAPALFYDLPRIAYLFATNPYMKDKVKRMPYGAVQV